MKSTNRIHCKNGAKPASVQPKIRRTEKPAATNADSDNNLRDEIKSLARQVAEMPPPFQKIIKALLAYLIGEAKGRADVPDFLEAARPALASLTPRENALVRSGLKKGEAVVRGYGKARLADKMAHWGNQIRSLRVVNAEVAS